MFIGPSGEDSLLVYTYDNVLYHYVINVTPKGMNLVPVGQIAFHGIVRAPARVRAMSWVLPDNQLRKWVIELAFVHSLIHDQEAATHRKT